MILLSLSVNNAELTLRYVKGSLINTDIENLINKIGEHLSTVVKNILPTIKTRYYNSVSAEIYNSPDFNLILKNDQLSISAYKNELSEEERFNIARFIAHKAQFIVLTQEPIICEGCYHNQDHDHTDYNELSLFTIAHKKNVKSV